MLRTTKGQCMEVIQLHFVSFRENIFKLLEEHETALSCAQDIVKVWSLVSTFSINRLLHPQEKGALFI